MANYDFKWPFPPSFHIREWIIWRRQWKISNPIMNEAQWENKHLLLEVHKICIWLLLRIILTILTGESQCHHRTQSHEQWCEYSGRSTHTNDEDKGWRWDTLWDFIPYNNSGNNSYFLCPKPFKSINISHGRISSESRSIFILPSVLSTQLGHLEVKAWPCQCQPQNLEITPPVHYVRIIKWPWPLECIH